MNDVVNEVVALVRREVFSHSVSLRMELAPALPAVLGDQVQLQQVLINLVINGIEAMQPVTNRPRQLVIRSRQDHADQVLVTVTDCGIGISPENITLGIFDHGSWRICWPSAGDAEHSLKTNAVLRFCTRISK